MSKRYQGGILGVGFNPLQAPNAPTGVTATDGGIDTGQVSVSFTAPTNVGGSAITGYTGQSNPGGIAVTGSASPFTFTGLTAGQTYTFNIWALNSYGPSPAGVSGSITPAAARGVFSGNSGHSTLIQYVNIATTGNGSLFGNLNVGVEIPTACASSTRGLTAGGNASGNIRVNNIDYVTIMSTGNATDFGDLTAARGRLGACASSTRGVFLGGDNNAGTVADYVTIATTGNATTFGTIGDRRSMGSCGSTTRGIWGGGSIWDGETLTITAGIQYITIATTGSSAFFGSLTVSRTELAACSSNTRGLFAGGSDPSNSNVIDYVTIASTGNATDFGDLTIATYALAACSSSTRGLFAGGVSAGNTICYVTIASTGNATDFGDLYGAASSFAGCSNAHGGL